MGVSTINNVGGGLTAEEHEWLESLANYTPNMYDINPTKSTSAGATFPCGGTSSTSGCHLPVCGYDKIALLTTTVNWTYCFRFSDGTETETSRIVPNTWSDWISIPANAVMFVCWTNGNNYSAHYALLTKDSPYNPDNQ